MEVCISSCKPVRVQVNRSPVDFIQTKMVELVYETIRTLKWLSAEYRKIRKEHTKLQHGKYIFRNIPLHFLPFYTNLKESSYRPISIRAG